MEGNSIISDNENASLIPKNEGAKHHGKLSTYNLIALAVISVDSIRNLPINAQNGLPVVTFYIIVGLTFFLPLIMAAKELAVLYPITGGSYLWVQAAFGPKIGFLSIWLQWVYNVIWYPTIFTFISSTLLSLFSSEISSEPLPLLIGSMFFFWLLTAISCRGVQATSVVSTVCSIAGTLFPMVFIIILAISWLIGGHESQVELSWSGLIPTSNTMNNLAYFGNILFSMLGIEVVAMHAKEVENPGKSYPKALTISGIIIITTLTLASLSLCIIVSPQELSLLNGIMTAFQDFFNTYNMPWGQYFIGVAIILGSLGVASSWIIGLARGMQVACKDADMPAWMLKTNRYNMPYMILIMQGGIYSLLILSFTLFPSVNSSYWLLSTMTSQFALVYYVVLFVAVIKLEQIKGKLSWKTAFGPVVAILASLVGVFVGYLPPENILAGDYFVFEISLIGGEILFFLPLLAIWKRKTEIKELHEDPDFE